MQQQAQAPAAIARVIQKVRSTTIELQPRKLEILTTGAARRLLYRVYRSIHPWQVVEEFLRDAYAIIDENVFVSFLAGMKKAAREFGREHASPDEKDFIRIQALRAEYRQDFERIVRDMVQDAVVDHKIDLPVYMKRCDILCQMGIWRAYNSGKLSVFREENKIAQAANYKYLGYFMFKTAADDSVCPICAPDAGSLSPDLDLLPQPPLHVWCRCELVAIPTVPTLEEQTDFLEEWLQQQTPTP